MVMTRHLLLVLIILRNRQKKNKAKTLNKPYELATFRKLHRIVFEQEEISRWTFAEMKYSWLLALASSTCQMSTSDEKYPAIEMNSTWVGIKTTSIKKDRREDEEGPWWVGDVWKDILLASWVTWVFKKGKKKNLAAVISIANVLSALSLPIPLL